MSQDTNPQADRASLREQVRASVLRAYCANVKKGTLNDGDRFIIDQQTDNIMSDFTKLLASAKPEPPTEAEFRENAQYCLGIYDGVNVYDAAIRAVLGKGSEG